MAGSLISSKPRNVAFTTLIGFELPRTFVKISRIPTAVTTARTLAPAMTPVPGAAGFSITLAAPNFATVSWGMVLPLSVMLTIFFRAMAVPFRTASGTSPALPKPMPTFPEPSPTTTIALKLKLRPPFTTLATRLMSTTLS